MMKIVGEHLSPIFENEWQIVLMLKMNTAIFSVYGKQLYSLSNDDSFLDSIY